MSDASHSHEEEAHEGPIKTPGQLIKAVIFSFVIPIFAIVLLATFVTSAKRPAAGSDGLGAEATALRISRVGHVEVKDASNPAALKTGDPLLFLATGTGISPFHSFVTTRPDLRYTLLHGVRFAAETALEAGFDPAQVHSCVSREDGGSFRGRVTAKLKTLSLSPSTHAFLCGNCDMIYEAFDVLRAAGVASDRIYTEVYF